MQRALLSALIVVALVSQVSVAAQTSRSKGPVTSPTVNAVAQGWLTRANQYYDQGKWEDAKQAFLGYLEEVPNDYNAIANLGVCYQELRDYELALRNFDRALVLNPEHWQALYNKVVVLGFHVNKKDQAKRLMRKLQKLQPDNPDVRRLAEAVAKL